MPPNSDIEFALALGEIRGQLRELIHGINNRAQRDEEVNRALGELSSLPEDIKEIKASVGDIDRRLTSLELAKAEDQGTRNLLGLIFRSPLVAWLLAAGVLLYTKFQEFGA